MSDPGAPSAFHVSGTSYDDFMGRYSSLLAPRFADFALPRSDARFLDVGCGPGALTAVAAARLGADRVAAVDPSPEFVSACGQRCPGADVRRAPAEDLPFADAEFDAAAAQLVFHFVTDPMRAVAEMRRVVRSTGTVAAAVWDSSDGMQLLRSFWDAVASVDPETPSETLRFGAPGELTALFLESGLGDAEEASVEVASTYDGFDQLWNTLLAGVGPAGAYTVRQPAPQRARLRAALHHRLGEPDGPFTLTAVARMTRAYVP